MEWNDVDSFISVFNILFNFLVNFTANCSPLSETTLSGNLCNFHTLSLNSLTNLSTDVLSIVVTKCIILDNLSHTIKIASFSTTNGNLVIKSTVRCVYGFFGISLNFNFSASTFVLFFIL